MSEIAETWRRDTQAMRRQFGHARPFRHLIMDGFLEPDFARALLDEFPPFELGDARNEQGAMGGKAVVDQIRRLGPPFAALDDLIQSTAFLEWLSACTGIEGLRYDPHYFGGGTHENRHGQELDPHIDFNRHPVDGSHRRLNLIVYLNEEWDESWGGALELHTDPRSERNEVTRITPLFNRCVLFETTEHSWHGFARINLPESQRHRSRRSIALYFYTLMRPVEETAPEHSTVYVDRPLPEHLRAGHQLTEEDIQTLKSLFARRDQHAKRLYDRLSVSEGRIAPERAMPGTSNHLSRFLLGLARIAGERESRSAKGTKAALKPFVSELPTGWQWPVRKLWRLFTRTERCALCGATGDLVQPIGEVAPTHPGPFEVERYRLVYCADCGCIRLDPTPNATDLKTLYQGSDQFSDATYTDPERVEQMLEYYGGCLERHHLLPEGASRVLEVGAGFAWVSRACKRKNPDTYTLAQDLSDECADRCDWVDEYRVGTIESLPVEPRFDLISLTHVIEHVPDPGQTLAELARRLTPNGRIFITAPHRPAGWKPEEGLPPWTQYSYLHVPAHISYLSSTWFERVAGHCGLRVLHWNAQQDHDQAFEAVLGPSTPPSR